MSNPIDYKSSGVDVESGDQLVDWIKSRPPIGMHKNLLGGIGGFASLFRLDLNGISKPILVSCTDGVGTKVKIAAEFNNLRPTGIDLVAMCVNDMIVCGAKPLFFLDYYASGKLNPQLAQDFLTGVMDGLKESNCTLAGGETAEMPGHYKNNDYDCAGFCVGIVDEAKIIDGSKVKKGDVAIGVSSSGFHSNGFSLLRKLFEKDLKEHIDLLLTPTRIYVEFVEKLLESVSVHAMAHITGSGILGNAGRTLPVHLGLKLNRWPWPDIFLEVQRRSQLSPEQMLGTFNCGIGYVVYVDQKSASQVMEIARKLGYQSWPIGMVVDRVHDEVQL